ncbi:MAG TPA: hypothetical protein VGN16_22290 [Acidobacteriaceae bacterium]|jgi:deferrochelatase/peroxidase EfeB
MSMNAVDFRDVQGIVRFGYGRLTEAVFLLLNIRDAAIARRWLHDAPVSNAVACDTAPLTALQVAFTSPGLARLGLADNLLEGFSIEFRAGMSQEPGRSRLLGDTGANAPEHWQWGGPNREPHMLVMLYAQPGHLDAWIDTVKGPAWNDAFELVASLDTSDMGGTEPFGFTDGVSQPTLDWEGAKDVSHIQTNYSNLSSLGEFLLGYTNEYGRYTGRPLVSPDDPRSADLPSASDVPGMHDFGRNGCYLVLRTMQQDVQAFWRFASEKNPSSDEARDEFAAAMVGRNRDGTPLVSPSSDVIPGIDAKDAPLNQFTFDGDAMGTDCPFGAHIRRANPRNADMPTPPAHGLQKALQFVGLGAHTLQSDAKASTRFHRILRRGREYGTVLSVEDAIHSDTDTGGRGIHFMCLVANIARQFEFLQGAWMMSSKFDAMTDEADPLLGTRLPVAGATTDGFTRPQQNGLCQHVSGVPQFITVQGGAYFFLPSLSAIRYLASLNAVA